MLSGAVPYSLDPSTGFLSAPRANAIKYACICINSSELVGLIQQAAMKINYAPKPLPSKHT